MFCFTAQLRQAGKGSVVRIGLVMFGGLSDFAHQLIEEEHGNVMTCDSFLENTQTVSVMGIGVITRLNEGV